MSELVVYVGELGWVVGVISFVECVRLDVERLRLIQLLGDLPPHLLWHRAFHSVNDPVELEPHLSQIGLTRTRVQKGLEPTSGHHAGVHVHLGVRADKSLITSFNWLAAGTHTGLLDPPGLAPTGKRVEIDVREIAEIRNGLASRIRLVVDMGDFMRQLGLFPAPGSHGERAIAMMQRLQMKLSRRF